MQWIFDCRNSNTLFNLSLCLHCILIVFLEKGLPPSCRPPSGRRLYINVRLTHVPKPGIVSVTSQRTLYGDRGDPGTKATAAREIL